MDVDVKRSVAVVEKRRKKIMRENLKPKTRLIKQQRPWRSNQKSEAGDLRDVSAESSELLVLKLLLLRFCCKSFMFRGSSACASLSGMEIKR